MVIIMELYGGVRKKRQVMFSAGIFMVIMATGIYRCFCDAFNYPANYKEIYLSIIIFSLIFTVTGICVNLLKNILYGLYSAAFGGYILLKADYLKDNFNVLFSYIMKRREEYMQSADSLNPSEVSLQTGLLQNNSKVAVIIIVGIFLLIMSICIFSLKSRLWSFFPALTVVALGMLYGKAPGIVSCVLLFAGAIGIAYSVTNGKMENKNRLIGYVILFSAMCFCMIAANYTMLMTKEKILSKNDDVLKKQHEYEKIIKNEVLNIVEEFKGNISQGKMTNISPVYKGKKTFRVIVDKKPQSKLYFKEFSADTYKNGRWTIEADQSQFYSYRLKNIFSYAYDTVRKKSDKSYGELVNMKIEYDKKQEGEKKKLSLPYFSDVKQINTNKPSQNENKITVDSGIKLDDAERSITRKSDRYYIKCYTLSNEGIRRLLNSSEKVIKDVDYAAYVERNYLTVPDSEKIKRYASGIEYNMEIGTQCDNIKRILQSDTQYSTKPGILPFGKEYLEYFLFKNKKGFCEHYATASTLLLRVKNVPARYVSGYMVTPSQFKTMIKKNAEGEIIDKYYVAQVYDYDAHAWSEVYKEGTGWIPVDMTKASSESEEGYERNRVEEPTASPDAKKTVKKNKVKPTVKPKKKMNKVNKNKTRVKIKTTKKPVSKNKSVKTSENEVKLKQNSKKANITVPIYVKVMLFMVLIIAVFIGFTMFVRPLLFYLFYKKGIQKAADNSEMLFVARKYMAKYMGLRGRKFEKLSDDEYMEKLSGICDIGDIGRIFEKAAFSQNDISKDELFYCLGVMNEIALKIRAEKSLHCLSFELNLLQNFIIEKVK